MSQGTAYIRQVTYLELLLLLLVIPFCLFHRPRVLEHALCLLPAGRRIDNWVREKRVVR